MSVKNGIITGIVSLKDPYDCMGVAKRGGKYDVGYICSNKHNKTNTWSRFKPMHLRGVLRHVDAQWWKGSDGRCGMKLPVIRSYRDIPSMMTEDKMNGWEYLPPTGGSFSPYRLKDFENYYHNAECFIHDFHVTEKPSTDGYLTASCALGFITGPDAEGGNNGPGSLALEDIRGDMLPGELDPCTLADYYLGIVIVDENGNVKGRVVGGSMMHLQTKYKMAELLLHRTYKAYPFLAKYPMEQNSTDIQNSYFTIPNTSAASFTVSSPEGATGINIYITAKYLYALGEDNKSGISYSVKITADNGTIEMKKNYINMRFSTSDLNEAFHEGEISRKLDDPITISPSSPYSKMGLFEINSKYANMEYYLYLTLSTGKFTRKVIPMMSIPTLG